MPRSKRSPVSQPSNPEPCGEDKKLKPEVMALQIPPLPKPRWDFWGEMRQVKLVQAVMLSCDIAPELPRQLAGRRWTYDYPNEVARRLMIASNHLGRLGPLYPRDTDGAVTNVPSVQPELFATVNLAEFSDFALARGWDIPQEFPSSSKANTDRSQTGRKKGAKWTEEERNELRSRVDGSSFPEAAAYFGLCEQSIRNQYYFGRSKPRYR